MVAFIFLSNIVRDIYDKDSTEPQLRPNFYLRDIKLYKRVVSSSKLNFFLKKKKDKNQNICSQKLSFSWDS